MILSIIIPCFNHGKYIRDALNSIKNIHTSHEYEVIIINDGSTEQYTIDLLAQLSEEGCQVIHQMNKGLAIARNVGISASRGKYIIPLDSDNMVHSNYLTKAIDILENDPSIDVVYGNPIFFGDENKIKNVGKCQLGKLLNCNYIDACAVFRKILWERLGGFDSNMPGMGNEDWEFWIHAYITGSRFYFFPEVCFYYRVVPNSMSATITGKTFLQNKEYIYKKHYKAIIEQLIKGQNMIDYLKNHRIKGMVKLVSGYRF